MIKCVQEVSCSPRMIGIVLRGVAVRHPNEMGEGGKYVIKISGVVQTVVIRKPGRGRAGVIELVEHFTQNNGGIGSEGNGCEQLAQAASEGVLGLGESENTAQNPLTEKMLVAVRADTKKIQMQSIRKG